MSGTRASTARACFTLRSNQLEALREVSRETGAPVAELTRRAVDAFLVNRIVGYRPGPLFPASGPNEAAATPLRSPLESPRQGGRTMSFEAWFWLVLDFVLIVWSPAVPASTNRSRGQRAGPRVDDDRQLHGGRSWRGP